MTRQLETKGYCYIACEVKRFSDSGKAVLIHDGIRDAWIPVSQIEDPDIADLEAGGPGMQTELLLPEWLAREKGLI